MQGLRKDQQAQEQAGQAWARQEPELEPVQQELVLEQPRPEQLQV